MKFVSKHFCAFCAFLRPQGPYESPVLLAVERPTPDPSEEGACTEDGLVGATLQSPGFGNTGPGGPVNRQAGKAALRHGGPLFQLFNFRPGWVSLASGHARNC